LFALPSYKFSTRLSGSFSTGTAGCGGIGFWPFRMLTSDLSTYPVAANTFANPSVVATTPAYGYDNTDYNLFNNPSVLYNASAPPVGLSIFQVGCTSMFPLAQFTQATGIGVRLVGGGLQIQCTSNNLTKQGDSTFFQNPSATGGMDTTADSLASILQLQSTIRHSTARVQDGATVTYMPCSTLDFEPSIGYSDKVGRSGTGVASNAVYDRLACGILISGAAAASPQTFSFTAIAHFEAYGRGLMRTPSYGDPGFLASALSASSAPLNVTPGATASAVVAAVSGAGKRRRRPRAPRRA